VQTPTCVVADCWQVIQAHIVTIDGDDSISFVNGNTLNCSVVVSVGVVVGVSVKRSVLAETIKS